MPPPSVFRRQSRLALALAIAFLAAACATFDPTNPLVGRWTAVAPLGAGDMGFALGSYEFRRNSMRAFGMEQRVDYSFSGNSIFVVPESFGPTFEIEMIDRDTARLKDPITGGLLTLRRTS